MCCRGEGERFLLVKLNGELFHAVGKIRVSFEVLTSNLRASSDFMAVSKMLTAYCGHKILTLQLSCVNMERVYDISMFCTA